MSYLEESRRLLPDMSKSGQKVVTPNFSHMSDEELLVWYAELQVRAMNPLPEDVDFDHFHQAAKPMTAEQLRHRIMIFHGLPKRFTAFYPGSPSHNLWHWLND